MIVIFLLAIPKSWKIAFVTSALPIPNFAERNPSMLANGFSLVAVSSCEGLLLVCFGLEEKMLLKKPWDSTGMESFLFSTAGFFTISVDLKKFCGLSVFVFAIGTSFLLSSFVTCEVAGFLGVSIFLSSP